MQKPNVLLLGGSDALEADLKLALRDVCTIMPLNVPAELIADEYRRVNPGAAIVVVSAQTPQRFGVIYNIVAAGGVVIVISPTKDPELILRAMRAGAREFVLESDHEELKLAVRSQAQVTEQVDGNGSVITVFGAKGGVGCTTIASNLAGARARARARGCHKENASASSTSTSTWATSCRSWTSRVTTRSPTSSRTWAASIASCSSRR
jgi:pilus assembly protein CpaE